MTLSPRSATIHLQMHYTGAAITPPSVNLLTGSTHVINCVFSDLKSQLTSVKWTASSTTSNVYTSTENAFSGKTQTSTLNLSSAQLAALRTVGGTHTLTCTSTIGVSSTTVKASQTVTISYKGGIF